MKFVWMYRWGRKGLLFDRYHVWMNGSATRVRVAKVRF